MRDAVRMQEMEDKYGVRLAFVDNEFGPGAAGMLSFNVMAAVAQYYSDNLRSEVLKGITEKARQGWAPGLAPFGYINDGNDKNEPIKPHPEKAQTLQRIFELYSRGNYTFKLLSKQLHKEGHTFRPTEPKFNRTALSYILNNRFYIGEITLRGLKFAGKHKQIISRAVFERCQEILHGKNRRTGSPKIAFSGGLFRCSICGCGITGERIKRKLKGGGHRIHTYYKCANNNPNPDHPVVRWKEEDIEKAIIEELKTMVIPDKATREAFRQTLEYALGNAKEYEKQQSQQKKKRLSELEAMKERLPTAYLSGIIDETILQNKTAEIESEKKSIEDSAKMSAIEGDCSRDGDGNLTAFEEDYDTPEKPDRIRDMEHEHFDCDKGTKNLKNGRIEEILALFDMTQNIESLWRGSNFDEKRQILDLVYSNRDM